MKICFLSSAHPPFDKRVFAKEAVTLATHGFGVMHLCPGSPDEAGWHHGVEVKTYRRNGGIRGRLRNLYSLFKQAAAEDVDAYHANEVDSWVVAVALRIFTGRRCVFDVHEH